MTAMHAITVDHLRELIEADRGDATLRLLMGRIETGDPSPANEGALDLITRDELVERLGPDPSDDELRDQAEALTVAVENLGG